jgi:hypothetical protein
VTVLDLVVVAVVDIAMTAEMEENDGLDPADDDKRAAKMATMNGDGKDSPV